MRIQFERTGGFAGVRLFYAARVENLPPAERDELTRLVAKSRFFELPDVERPSAGVDRFEYVISIDDSARSRTLHVGESTMPPRLGPLVEWLTKAARTPQA